MNLIVPAGLCSLIPPFYFIRLMADARKLRRQLRESRSEFREDAQEEERFLIEPDGASGIVQFYTHAITRPGAEPDRLSSGQN